MSQDTSSARGHAREQVGAHDPAAADQTSGSPQRASRDLGGDLRKAGIMEVMERLRHEPAFETDGRNSETVLHDGAARVVLTALDQGREVGPQVSDGHVVLVLLEGAGTLAQGDERTDLDAGELAMLAPDAGWSFQAARPCAIVACFWQPS